MNIKVIKSWNKPGANQSDRSSQILCWATPFLRCTKKICIFLCIDDIETVPQYHRSECRNYGKYRKLTLPSKIWYSPTISVGEKDKIFSKRMFNTTIKYYCVKARSHFTPAISLRFLVHFFFSFWWMWRSKPVTNVQARKHALNILLIHSFTSIKRRKSLAWTGLQAFLSPFNCMQFQIIPLSISPLSISI